MNPSQEISRELQQAIDAEIEALEESIRALKLRRNTLSPISCLPPEVLVAIFTILCVPSTPQGGMPDHHLARHSVTSVINGARLPSINASCGVTSISPPSV